MILQDEEPVTETEIDNESELLDGSECPENLIIQSELAESVRLAVSELGEKDRQIVTEVYLNGKTVVEVSQETGENWFTLNKRLHRALAKLKYNKHLLSLDC